MRVPEVIPQRIPFCDSPITRSESAGVLRSNSGFSIYCAQRSTFWLFLHTKERSWALKLREEAQSVLSRHRCSRQENTCVHDAIWYGVSKQETNHCKILDFSWVSKEEFISCMCRWDANFLASKRCPRPWGLLLSRYMVFAAVNSCAFSNGAIPQDVEQMFAGTQESTL